MERDINGRFVKGMKSWNSGLNKNDYPSLKNMGFKSGRNNPMKKEHIINKVKQKLKNRCIRKTIFSKEITSKIHKEVTKIKGKPRVCENCGTINKSKYDWANISGKYKNDINDYIRLCISCHRLYDFGKIKVKRKYKIQ